MSIKKAQTLLKGMLEKDPEAFDKLINTRFDSKNEEMPTYSVLSILNSLFGTDQVGLEIWYDKETDKTEKVLILDAETFKKVYRS
jgi:hypothetical protein